MSRPKLRISKINQARLGSGKITNDSISPLLDNPVLHYNMASWMGVGGICLVVKREWENFMALSLYEP